MATGGTGAGLELSGRSAHGPGAGPGPVGAAAIGPIGANRAIGVGDLTNMSICHDVHVWGYVGFVFVFG